MKLSLTVVFSAIFFASSVYGQGQDMFSLRADGVPTKSSPAEGPGPVVCDDMESLFLGFVDAQQSSVGVDYVAFDAMVVDSAGNQVIEQINTFGDDVFFSEIFSVFDASGMIPAIGLAGGAVLEIDYTLTDNNTQWFFTPQGDTGFIVTRFGNFSNAGTWGWLDTSPTCDAGLVVDTGIPMAAAGTIRFEFMGTNMNILVNGAPIVTNEPIIGGGTGCPGPVPIIAANNLLNVAYQSNNNAAGLGTVLTIDNISINEGCGGGPACCPGDVNGDGTINLLDISPFVAAVLAGGFVCEADTNGDGAVNLLDVAPFIALVPSACP